MKVKDAMHRGVEWREPGTPVKEIAKVMRESDVGAVPISEAGRLVGIITDRDIACRAVANGNDIDKLTAADIMTQGIIYCTEGEDVEDAVHLMEDNQIRRLPVLDDEKRMVGMLSLGDLTHSVSRELVGELAEAVAEHH